MSAPVPKVQKPSYLSLAKMILLQYDGKRKKGLDCKNLKFWPSQISKFSFLISLILNMRGQVLKSTE